MSSRLMEECFELENFTDNYISIEVDKETFFIVVDPYIINLSDLLNMKPGSIGIIRMRRPGWGNYDVRKAIQVVKVNGGV